MNMHCLSRPFRAAVAGGRSEDGRGRGQDGGSGLDTRRN